MGTVINKALITLIVQTCKELTSIELYGYTVDDAAVIIVAQYCFKLGKLELHDNHKIKYNSLIALSERGLPLKELNINPIPLIPTADIARRCSHALSCIHNLNTYDLHQNGQDASILIPKMTGLTSVYLKYYSHSYIPLLT